MTAEDLIALNEQIAAMARAGLPLDQDLASLAEDMGRGRLRAVTRDIADDLRAGHPLPEALSRQQGRIPAYYSNLVTAGVRTGRLPEVLTNLTIYARTVAATRATVIEAMIYPAIVLVIGGGMFLALAFFILPQFDQVFRDFGMKLPQITEWALMIGRYPVEILVIPGTILLTTGVVAGAWARYTSRGNRTWARFVAKVPLIGPVIRAARLAAFVNLLAMMVEYAVPLPNAFRLAGEASTDPSLRRRAIDVAQCLEDGMPIAQALHECRVLPDWVAWLATAGERRGALAPALREIAIIYRRQVDGRSAILRTVLPSFVVLSTAGALVVIFVNIVAAPMIRLLEGLSK